MTKVAVFGLGYVGCVTAACLAQDGHEVIGVDVDASKVEEVSAGRTPIVEPGLEEILTAQVKSGRLTATSDIVRAVERSDVGLVAVGTPSADDGSLTTTVVERVMTDIGRAVASSTRPYHVVVRSTLLPGVLENNLGPRLVEAAKRPLGANLTLSNNPEFLRETSAVKDYYNPPFVIVGADDDRAGETVMGLYEKVPGERIVTDARTAALVKYACNAFHALKVSFANEIGAIAKTLSADGHAVMDMVCRDTKLNISKAYMRPGFAFGGSCLPKDVRALNRHAQQIGLKTDLISSLLPSNQSQLERGLKLIRASGARKIGLVGLSFKAATDDLRESPLVSVAEQLLGGGFDLKIFDPHVSVSRLRGRNRAYVDQHLPHLAKLLVPSGSELVEHADLVVIGTDVVSELPEAMNSGKPVVDLRFDLAR